MDSLLESVWLRRRRLPDTDCLAALREKKKKTFSNEDKDFRCEEQTKLFHASRVCQV